MKVKDTFPYFSAKTPILVTEGVGKVLFDGDRNEMPEELEELDATRFEFLFHERKFWVSVIIPSQPGINYAVLPDSIQGYGWGVIPFIAEKEETETTAEKKQSPAEAEENPYKQNCGDCAKFDECKAQGQTDENETFPETGGCEAFERKESKQGKKNDHCDTCLFYGEDGICVVHKEKIARPYKKSCPAYLPSAVQLDLDEKLFQLKARRAYVNNYSFDTTVPCKDCVYCNPRTKKCFNNYQKPETWDGEDGDYYCGHGVERSKSE